MKQAEYKNNYKKTTKKLFICEHESKNKRDKLRKGRIKTTTAYVKQRKS